MRRKPETSLRISLRGLIPRDLASARLYLLLDQIVFSLASFILTIALARMYSASEFGSYGIGLAIALMVQSIQRNFYIVPLSLMSRRVATRCAGALVAEHLTVTGASVALAALVTALVAAMGPGGASLDISLATLVCITLYFQSDFDRAIQVKRGSYRGALGLSLVYLATVIAVSAFAKFHHVSFATFMVTLAAVCTLRSSWLFFLHVQPHWSWGMRLLGRDWRRYGVPALLQAGAASGCQHIPLMILATVSGSAQVGGFSAMRSLTQPLMLVFRSLDAADKNRIRTASSGGTAGARRFVWRTTLFYGAIGAAALLILGLFHERIISLAYHGKYSGLGGILIGWTIYSVLLGLGLPIGSLAYLLHRQRPFTAWTLVSGVVGIALALGLCGPFGMWGAMSATGISAAVSLLGGFIVTRDVIVEGRDVPLPKEMRRAVPAPSASSDMSE
ncbi:MAG TPA: lipopolysaccharide biosynthesis protein [Steroidobacteraceae bacterium]|jgi:O-antigen/teichoic acid export membrane protein|nr:lipopolysaccharide biosynthesis protein [Steroidobacteraceae bacterium]